MNDYVAKMTLDLNCQATPVVISAGQFDIGRKIQITLTADGDAYDATGATVVCKGKNNNNYFAVNAAVSKNIVTVTTDKAMLSSAGRTIAKIVLTDGTHTYSTQPFVINTHSDYDGDITTSDYYPELLNILSRVLALTDSGAVLTDTALSATSVNPVQNKALKAIIDTINSRLQSAEQTLKGKANATDISNALKSKEDGSNKVDTTSQITDATKNYPSIEYLNENYWSSGESYSSDEVDVMMNNKADSKNIDERLTRMNLNINSKYDTSNIEYGTATLTPYTTQVDKIKSATCVYEKIGDIAVINVNVIMNETSLGATSAITLLNMPFANKSDIITYDIGVSKNGGMFRGSVSKAAWLQFTPLNKQAYSFATDEQVNFSLIYKV